MAQTTSDGASEAPSPQSPPNPDKATARRQIPGNLPYLTSSGTLKTILNKIIELAKPDKFNYDFLNNVVKMTGGSAKSCIPILKKMEFLQSDNSTTELYNKFRTESGRSSAAYQGLRNAFPEIFKRSDYAYSVDDGKLKDVIVEITGLKGNDPVAQAIKGTFNVIKSFIASDFNHSDAAQSSAEPLENRLEVGSQRGQAPSDNERSFGMAYNINIIVPETSDVAVLNAIFRAVRENLLQ